MFWNRKNRKHRTPGSRGEPQESCPARLLALEPPVRGARVKVKHAQQRSRRLVKAGMKSQASLCAPGPLLFHRNRVHTPSRGLCLSLWFRAWSTQGRVEKPRPGHVRVGCSIPFPTGPSQERTHVADKSTCTEPEPQKTGQRHIAKAWETLYMFVL